MKKFFLLIVLLIVINEFSSYPILSENKIIGHIYTDLKANINKNELNGYILSLNQIDPELCYLAIGSVNNFELIENLFLDIGTELKNKNFDFVIFGNLKTLNKETTDYLNYIGKSPYLISEVLYRMIRGFETAGIVPVLKITSDDDTKVKNSLKNRAGAIYTYSEEINNLDMYLKNNNVYLKKDRILRLPWKTETSFLKDSIKSIYENSIILSGWRKDNSKLLYRKINFTETKMITYFSHSVESLAKEVLDGKKLATGKITW
ncbi:hypothetical protein [Tepiditoga spiralis]|uniref:hypothetical protein n=1 Tax=Tepiditoga spiralis TaxID=2108365 RepID=UPI001688EBE7|nr:hypothetical protein [Tepiditoga spiralis]